MVKSINIQTVETALKWYRINRPVYEKLAKKVHNILFEVFEIGNISYQIIENRAKKIDSYQKKINKRYYSDPINQITDLAGIRVITLNEDQLTPVLKIINDLFEVDDEKSVDKIKELGTKLMGYRGIKIIAKFKSDRLKLLEYKQFENLRFEIQVRTYLAHFCAVYDHHNYKNPGDFDEDKQRDNNIIWTLTEAIEKLLNKE